MGDRLAQWQVGAALVAVWGAMFGIALREVGGFSLFAVRLAAGDATLWFAGAAGVYALVRLALLSKPRARSR